MNQSIISLTEINDIITNKLKYQVSKRTFPSPDNDAESIYRLFISGMQYIKILYNNLGVKKLMTGINSVAGLVQIEELNIDILTNEITLLHKCFNFNEETGSMMDLYYTRHYQIDNKGKVVGYKDTSHNYWDDKLEMDFHFSTPKEVILDILYSNPIHP